MSANAVVHLHPVNASSVPSVTLSLDSLPLSKGSYDHADFQEIFQMVLRVAGGIGAADHFQSGALEVVIFPERQRVPT